MATDRPVLANQTRSAVATSHSLHRMLRPSGRGRCDSGGNDVMDVWMENTWSYVRGVELLVGHDGGQRLSRREQHGGGDVGRLSIEQAAEHAWKCQYVVDL